MRNVAHDQRKAVEHKHTYIHILTLWARAQWRPFRLLWEKTGEWSGGYFVKL